METCACHMMLCWLGTHAELSWQEAQRERSEQGQWGMAVLLGVGVVAESQWKLKKRQEKEGGEQVAGEPSRWLRKGGLPHSSSPPGPFVSLSAAGGLVLREPAFLLALSKLLCPPTKTALFSLQQKKKLEAS